jgi:hypothetical protein
LKEGWPQYNNNRSIAKASSGRGGCGISVKIFLF